MKIKKGDNVVVLSGKDKGKTGEVRTALPGRNRVVVEGVNLRWQHKRPTQQNPKGERVQVEAPIHASNVKLHAAESKKASKKTTKKKKK